MNAVAVIKKTVVNYTRCEMLVYFRFRHWPSRIDAPIPFRSIQKNRGQYGIHCAIIKFEFIIFALIVNALVTQSILKK